MSNEEKSKQLGMPFGTANARLRKLILFNLVTKYNENNCYRCSKIIIDINNFSIDHKLPWFGESTNLFWDINNISFSHSDCNTAARRITIKDSKTCWICKKEKFKSEFYTGNSSCKVCSIKSKDKYRRDKGLRPTTPKFLRGSKYEEK